MKPKVHYHESETASYMADKTTIRSILAFAAATNYPLSHFDITSAYRHEPASTSTTVYVKQHPQFDGSYKHKEKFGVLKRNLYGGKSAAYFYCQGLQSFLKNQSYNQSPHDPLMFFKITSESFILLGISGDDFLVTASNQNLIQELLNVLETKYNIKDLGFPTKYLGWTITKQPDISIHISKPESILSLFESIHMYDCNPRHTPYEQKANLTTNAATDTSLPHKSKQYQKVIGEPRYITDCTRPDITFIVNSLAAATHYPTTRHWALLKFLMRYLKGTIYHGILFKPIPPQDQCIPMNSEKSNCIPLSSFSDADFPNDVKDRKSISGGIHTFYGSPIAWHSVKKRIQALSTCEAEYIAATSTAQLAQWLRRLLSHCHLISHGPVPLFYRQHICYPNCNKQRTN